MPTHAQCDEATQILRNAVKALNGGLLRFNRNLNGMGRSDQSEDSDSHGDRNRYCFGKALEKQRNANKLSRDFFPRQFCVKATDDKESALALVAESTVNLNTPIWNIETAKPVVKDHSDLLNPRLIDVLRQLYEEGTRPETQMRLRTKRVEKGSTPRSNELPVGGRCASNRQRRAHTA